MIPGAGLAMILFPPRAVSLLLREPLDCVCSATDRGPPLPPTTCSRVLLPIAVANQRRKVTQIRKFRATG